MTWKVSQLNGHDLIQGSGKEDTIINVRDENQDNLFEIIPKLLIDQGLMQDESGGTGQVILVTTTAGSNSCTLTNNELLGIGFGKTFLVLSRDLNGVEKSLEFDSNIDFILWRKSVLLIGLSSSEIILLSPTTFERTASKKILPSDNINEDPNKQERFFVNAFIHSTSLITKVDLIAIGVTGDIYSFPSVSLAEDCLDFSTEESMMSICVDIENIKGTRLRSYLGQNAEVVSAVTPTNRIVATAERNGTISVFSVDDNETQPPADGPGLFSNMFFNSGNIVADLDLALEAQVTIKKLIHCEGLLFVLLSNGNLHMLDDENLVHVRKLRLPTLDSFIQDFSLVICNAQMVKLWIIYSNKDGDGGEHVVAIYPSPSFKVPEFTVKIPSLSTASVFKFPTQVSLFDEPTSFIEIEILPKCSFTKIYHMSECSTDISLQNLIEKGRFQKAELLARKYGKNLDIVWKAKVLAKADELLLVFDKDKACQKVFSELLATLKLISDADWICGFIVTEKRIPKIAWLKELLTIGLKKVSECPGSENGQKLLQTRKKLYTFEQVLPNASMIEWNQFNDEKNTMFQQCIWFLDHDEFQKCEVVWLRHCDEFISKIDIQHFGRFFKTLFESQLTSEPAICLFKTIFPFAVEKCEETENIESGISMVKINALMLLVRSQLRSLEREKTWPNEAIKFTERLINVVEGEVRSIGNEKSMGNSDEEKLMKKINICNKILEKLRYLLQALEELAMLKLNHSIRIPFDEYTNDNLTEVVNSMLRVLLAREEIELFVHNFLTTFVQRNKLDLDTLFLEHIKSVAEDVPYYANASGIPFEERVVTLVKYISNIKCKLECVLIIAEHWPVPWFKLMDDLVKQTIDINLQSYGDKECIEIQTMIKGLRIQVPYRCLQSKYRLIPHKLATSFGVQMALLRILKWKKPDYYQDCLELIKHTGKFDETMLRVFRFWVELGESDLPIEEVVPDDLTDVEILGKMLERVLLEFRTAKDIHQENEWKRFTDCGHLIGNRLNTEDSKKAIEYFMLRELIPNVWDDSIVWSSTYPFSALDLLLEQDAHSKSSEQLIQECNRLSIVSFTNYKNLLVVAAAFYALVPGPGSAAQKVWDIVERITENEELLDDLEYSNVVCSAAISIVLDLVLHIPVLSNKQLEMLHNFCRLIVNSFPKSVESISDVFGTLIIFETLREDEMPLETQFMAIYKEVWRDGIRSEPAFYENLKKLSESLLRYGSIELHNQIFNAVHNQLKRLTTTAYGKYKEMLLRMSLTVIDMKKSFLESAHTFEETETNTRVINLVKSLHEQGLSMNAYALRQRDKGKLISKLLETNLYQLASQTALVFDYKDANSWSQILRQYMKRSTINDLKILLESLKKIADLWVLQEFADAWLKVSEHIPTFRHMCPIPLDY